MDAPNLGVLVSEAARQFGARPLFICEGQTLSFRDADGRSSQIANALEAAGVAQGAHVAVMLPNGFDFPLAWFALAKLGAVIVPINSSYHDHDLTYTLRDSQASAIVLDQRYLPQWERVQAQLPGLRLVFVLGTGDTAFAQQIAQSEASWPGRAVGADDLLNIQYTSGTTGFPKGCMLTHDYWLRMGRLAADYFGLRPGEVDLTAQPFYYMDPQWNTVACLLGGAALVILPRFSPANFWPAVVGHGVTVVYMIGSMPLFLLKQPEDARIERGHRLRLVLCSGIHPGFHAEFERRWGVPWREAYGMTETGVDLIVPIEDGDSVGSGTMGSPIASKQARVVDPDGREVAAGQVGELLVRGQPMMRGYWNNPAATAEVLVDGWLHTGDLVVQDARGRFFWKARRNDTIRRAGENIAAAELEQVLLAHPAVRLAAVVPVPDDLRGQEVKAYLVLRERQAPDPEAILAYLRERLAAFKVPRYLEFMDDLPRTASERVEKHKLIAAQPDLRRNSYDAVTQRWWHAA